MAGLVIVALLSQGVFAVDAKQHDSSVESDPLAQFGAGGGSPRPLTFPPDELAGRTVRVVRSTDTREAPREQAATLSAAASGIPSTVLAAYQRAQQRLGSERSDCNLTVPLLAAIGMVESGHARDGDLRRDGTTRVPITGPALDGSPGVASIRDTDGGAYDGDRTWDRAVGPMQFIPSTWRRWGSDGNADGVADPHNIYDATLAAGRYLCAAGGDLGTPDGLRRAILAYNHSEDYLAAVAAWMRVYAGGIVRVSAAPERREESVAKSTEKRADSKRDTTDRSPRPRQSPGAEPDEPPARTPSPPPSSPPPPAPQPPPPSDDTGAIDDAVTGIAPSGAGNLSDADNV